MTTIAWDGETLAADSLSTSMGLRDHLCLKIGKAQNGRLWALTGDASAIRGWMKWVEDGHDPYETRGLPDLTGADRDDNSSGIMIMPDGRLFELNGPNPILEYEPIHRVQAWGSGFRIAMGALLAGADAKRAVEIAIMLDVHSGGQVRTVSLRD